MNDCKSNCNSLSASGNIQIIDNEAVRYCDCGADLVDLIPEQIEEFREYLLFEADNYEQRQRANSLCDMALDSIELKEKLRRCNV